MEEFILWLSREREYSATSVKQRLSAITSFMKYASRREMAALNAYTVVAGTEKPKAVKSSFPYFTLEEMRVLLRLPNTDRKIGKRDLVLLSVFYDSAARAQELCDLSTGDVKFGSPTKLGLIGKGRKAREIAVTPDVAALLRYHIKENGLEKQSPLFASQSGNKMTTACIAISLTNMSRWQKARILICFLNPSIRRTVSDTVKPFIWWNPAHSLSISAIFWDTLRCSLPKFMQKSGNMPSRKCSQSVPRILLRLPKQPLARILAHILNFLILHDANNYSLCFSIKSTIYAVFLAFLCKLHLQRITDISEDFRLAHGFLVFNF